MSIINIQFDTNSKECSVQINGTKLEDVIHVGIYKYSTNPEIVIETRGEEEDGMRVTKIVTADNHEELSKATSQKVFDDNLVEIKSDNKEVYEYLYSQLNPNSV